MKGYLRKSLVIHIFLCFHTHLFYLRHNPILAIISFSTNLGLLYPTSKIPPYTNTVYIHLYTVISQKNHPTTISSIKFPNKIRERVSLYPHFLF